MKTKVGVVHTFLYSVEDIRQEFQRQLPNVEVVNIIDDSLLKEALANKGVTPGILGRMCDYYRICETLGCACVLNQCSSMGEAADIAAKFIKIPVFKIDVPMARQAVELGSKIAVIATAVSTVGPSVRLIESTAKAMGEAVTVEPCFVEGAYDLLLVTGDREKHDQMVLARIAKAAKTNDVIVLAQGSLYRLLPLVGDIGKPVLTSLKTGVGQIRDLLKITA